ncbi:hypothetical protein LguiA_010830 [Lonicera macranthoides]
MQVEAPTLSFINQLSRVCFTHGHGSSTAARWIAVIGEGGALVGEIQDGKRLATEFNKNKVCLIGIIFSKKWEFST